MTQARSRFTRRRQLDLRARARIGCEIQSPDAAGKAARLRAPRDLLMTAPSPVPQLLSVMIDGRLLLAESADGRATVTLIHEALIEEWPTLGRWLERDRTQMQRVQRQLQLLASPADGDRKYAVTALGQIGPSAPEVIPAILSTFSNSKERALIRVAAAEAWGHIGLLRQIGSAAPDVAGYVNPVAAALIAVICDRKDKVTVPKQRPACARGSGTGRCADDTSGRCR